MQYVKLAVYSDGVSRLVLGLIFSSLGLEIPGLVSDSVLMVSGLETLNIILQRDGLKNLYNSTIVCLLYLQVRNNQTCRKMPEIWKKFKSEVMTFKKISAKCTNFEVSSLALELQVSNLAVFDESSVSKF